MKKAIKFIIPGIIVLIIAGLSLSYFLSKRIPKNNADAIGNTAGNLNSGGLFCEYNNRIYFSNPYDGGKLYSMDPDCTNIEYMSDDKVNSINACGKFLYYIKNNGDASGSSSVIFRGEIYGVVRAKLNGSHTTTLVSGYCSDLALAGNSLVYNASRNSTEVTYSIGINGKDSKVIADINVPNACIDDGAVIYSSNSDNHAIYSMNVTDGENTLYLNANTYMANIVDNNLYYIDLDNDYALTKVDLDTSARTVLTTDHCVLYNVYDDVIYYQKENDEHALMRMNVDGSSPVQVVAGDITTISCTSKYTFLQMYGSDTLYRIETKGDTTVQTFFIQIDE